MFSRYYSGNQRPCLCKEMRLIVNDEAVLHHSWETNITITSKYLALRDPT